MRNGFERNFGFFFAGAIVGAAAVALTTPLTGRRARRIIRHKIEEASDQITHTAETLREGAEKIYARGEKMMKSVGALG